MIQYPERRDELIYYLKALADKQYVIDVWVNHNFPPGIYDCFDYAVHFFFDDTGLAENPKATIGFILENDTEVEAIQLITKSIDNLLDDAGKNLPDEEYINHSKWGNIIEASTNALKVFIGTT